MSTVSVFKFNAIRQFGHNPAGALAWSGAPHWGQSGNDSLLMPFTYRLATGLLQQFKPRNTLKHTKEAWPTSRPPATLTAASISHFVCFVYFGKRQASLAGSS